MACHRAGVDLTKVFPAPSYGGPAHLKTLLVPMPFLRLMPSGGVEIADIPAYLDAGALAVGLTGALGDRRVLQEADWATVEARAREVSGVLAAWLSARAGGTQARDA